MIWKMLWVTHHVELNIKYYSIIQKRLWKSFYLFDEHFNIPFDGLKRWPELLNIFARLEFLINTIDMLFDLVTVKRPVGIVFIRRRWRCAFRHDEYITRPNAPRNNRQHTTNQKPFHFVTDYYFQNVYYLIFQRL